MIQKTLQQTTPEQILAYWYSESIRAQWFCATPELDAEIRQRYEEVWRQAHAGGMAAWRDTPEGALALAIILDQFPLNMFRGSARAFSSEREAVQLVHASIARGFDKKLPVSKRIFMYMPLMHSEVLADQDASVCLFEVAGLLDNLKFAKHHREIVRRFGRFPHRNALLGRVSTQEEHAYLNSEEAFKG
ncbi:hypothetical protein BI364_03730 [Acidihalobacter yilgarnensis]|uniref:DUF924 domain-containing protein n=1 Tax=Acidihalobacter yilgarnensis TaxID=2819280 RepID=A0A1D8IL83_9GAMM|nr:DUF924 family protein [Acidihalobacter yilgarnensis]AOU97224.1 hypothetical protein BI364_03730 [Acidihalobacter yilgarnensis]